MSHVTLVATMAVGGPPDGTAVVGQKWFRQPEPAWEDNARTNCKERQHPPSRACPRPGGDDYHPRAQRVHVVVPEVLELARADMHLASTVGT